VPDRPLRILQVSFSDLGGGAERIAWELARLYRAGGHESWLAVGYPKSGDPAVFDIPNEASRGRWARATVRVGDALLPLAHRVRGADLLRKLLVNAVGQPGRWLARQRGHEDFDAPGTWRLLDLTPSRPDVVHAHNLHDRYFDLRALPWLSRQVPLVLTLHDAWMLSGHCAHSFDCERWRVGCGACPDLSIYPAVRRDATAFNWRRKQAIYAASRLRVATPSAWLMRRVEQSMLTSAVVEARVIPNGVDRSIFRPADRRSVRASLGLPLDAAIVLFAANGIRANPWKDYRTLRAAIAAVASQPDRAQMLFLALGEDAPPERLGSAELRFVPFERDPAAVARYFQAADLYVHAARADTFPTTVLEALACGVPVVATAVGGIPEQVVPLGKAGPDAATGALVGVGDAEGLAEGIARLLDDAELRRRLGANAASDAAARFDLRRQVATYLDWYRSMIGG
jgi:glycosyltransferase involved in cell wall biosynthesis